MTIIQTENRDKAIEISQFIWTLKFKKELLVDVAVSDNQSDVDVHISNLRYVVYVNSNMEKAYIKDYLLKNGYLSK